MAEFFSQHLRKIEALIAKRTNCDVMYVDYREALDSPTTVAEKVNHFLGGTLDVEKMSQVIDGRLYRNRANPKN